MNRLWKKRIPALFMALVLIVSLMPAALADEVETPRPGMEQPPAATEGEQTGGACQHANKKTDTKAATCEADGEEVVTCSDCGAEISQRVLPKLSHDWGSWGPDPSNDAQHLRTCKRSCGSTQTGSHNYSAYGHSDTEHWQTCRECGAESVRADHTMTQDSDADSHWNKCICGYTSDKGKHVDTDGNGACDTCGRSVHVHSYSTSWSSDASGHWHACSCGDKKDLASHGTANANGECPVCGYKLHKHTWAASWTQSTTQHWKECTSTINGMQCGEKSQLGNHVDGNGDSVCDTCGAKMSHTHVPAATPEKDASGHWYLCTVCKQIATAKANHVDSSPVDGKCDVCGWQMGNTFTVSFNTGSGATTVAAQTVQAGKSPVNVPATIARSGYTFLGWVQGSSVLVSTGSQSVLTSTQVMAAPVNGNLTYSAVYYLNAASQAVSINAGSGSSTAVGSSIQSQINSKFSTLSGSSITSFYMLEITGTSASSYGTVYTTSALNATVGRATYTSRDVGGWYFRPGTASGTYSLNYTARDSSGRNTVSGTISITSQVSGTDITLTAAPGKSVSFDIGKFQDAYRTKYSSGTIDYVEFSVPSSYTDFRGAVYDGSAKLSRNALNSGTYYYSGGSSGGRLRDLSFKADTNARNGDSLTITYYAYYNKNSYVTGDLILKVSGSASDGDVSYKVAPGKTVTLKSKDFQDYLRKSYSNEHLDYVRFDSSSFSGGTFYHKYGKSGETSFSSGSKLSREYFYESAGRDQYDLDELTFEASSSFKTSISIKFTAYSYTTSSHYVTGTLVINSTSKSTSGDIEYEVAPGKYVDLKKTDFREFLRDEEGKSAAVDYVQFRRPSSSSIFDGGTLYYNRGGGSGEVKLTRTNINSYKFHYTPGRNEYDLDDLTFVAASDFKGTISLDFTVYGTDDEYATGTLVLVSTTQSDKLDKGDINYKVAPGKSVDVAISDFRALLRKEYSSRSDVDYVQFRRPSSSTIFNNGTLYYDRGGNKEVALTRTNISSYKFHYDPAKNEYDLSELTFVAGSGFKDSVTLDFTIYGTDTDEELDGTLVFYTDASAAASSSYVGSVRYNTTAGTNVQIKADDINRFLRQSLPGYTLQYVTLTGVPSTGSLYYNYYGASKYGSTSRVQLTSSNCAGVSFYFNPTAATQYSLTELTYVPNGYNYCASIPFTAYVSSNLSVSGTILISVTQKSVPEVYGVTTRNTAASFSSSSIYNAVLNATGSALYSIQLLKLPPSTAGTIYVGSGTTTKAATNVQYTYASGTNSISQLRFVPASSYTGSVEVPYVALNSSGTALASGVFALGVVNTAKNFKDVGNTVWCYKYVTELSDANVIGGYTDGSFKPDSTLTYGAALKLIMLAAGYPEQAPTGKNVFSGYLDRARADGLVTRSNVNLSGPITRLQVAQLAAGALKLSTSNLSTVKPFTDTSDLYVQALNAAGIVEGYFSNGTSTYRPNNSLTRGQMSAIVWRMQNYRKG